MGRDLAIGSTVLRVTMPMVRCAMPLRAQPGGLAEQPALFRALSELNEAHPNHLGMCCDVVEPGCIEVGDASASPADLRPCHLAARAHHRGRRLANRAVIALLGLAGAPPPVGIHRGGPLRRRRSGRQFQTPVQWAGDERELVIFVARHGAKRWWRNFDGGHAVDVLVGRRWRPMQGEVVRGLDDPAGTDRLLACYLDRFPKATRLVPSDAEGRRDVSDVVLVRCRPRPTA
ncbi:MAG: hypothetical protein R2711_05405 [Acidimicrobiales bacterium]